MSEPFDNALTAMASQWASDKDRVAWEWSLINGGNATRQLGSDGLWRYVPSPWDRGEEAKEGLPE